MQSIRNGGFQPPCPKATEVPACFPYTICKQLREQRFLYQPSNFRYCGSRVFNTLVGVWGEQPQRNPSLALKIALDNKAVRRMLMQIEVLLRIAGVGLLVTVICQVLTRAGREDIATLAAVAGMMVVLLMVVSLAGDLLNQVREVFFLP